MFYEYQVKEGREWVTTYESEEPAEVYEALAHLLEAKYMKKVSWVTKVKRTINNDGTRTITFYEGDGSRDRFVVPA